MSFKAGDKVKVIGNTCGHAYKIGEIITLVKNNQLAIAFKSVEHPTGPYNIIPNDFEKFAAEPGVDCVF